MTNLINVVLKLIFTVVLDDAFVLEKLPQCIFHISPYFLLMINDYFLFLPQTVADDIT